MKLNFSRTGGSIADATKRLSETMARAVSAGMAGAAEGAKQDLRKQLRATSTRFASGRAVNAIRSAVYPNPPRFSGKAAFTVFAAGDSADRFLSAFDKGAVVFSKHKQALAVPLHNLRTGTNYLAGETNRFRGPKDPFWGGKLVYLPARNAPPGTIGYLCIPRSEGVGKGRRKLRGPKGARVNVQAQAARELIPVFVLIAEAKLPKLLSFQETMDRWAGRLPDLIRSAADILDK